MATWDNTQAGQRAGQAWDNLRDTYTRKVPGHVWQLRTLANRPISG